MHYLTNYYRNLAEQLQEQVNLLEAQLSQATKDETKELLAKMAKMDADRAARNARVNPITGRSINDVTGEAINAVQAREQAKDESFARSMPNLAARAKFSSQSVARSAAPGGSNAYSDAAAFGALSPDEQRRVVSTQSTQRLQGMRQAQYNTSSANVAAGRGGQAMGDNRASGANLINAELEDRRTNPMGGKDAAASYARTWSEDPTSLRTQQSMAVRTPRERIAMLDAMKEEGLKQIREKGRLDPKQVQAVNQFSKMGPRETELSKKFGEASREPLPGGKPIQTGAAPAPASGGAGAKPTTGTGTSTGAAPQASSGRSGKSYAELKAEQQARQTAGLLGLRKPGTGMA